ncbi:hypothetical protein D1872_216170 [compost metagenome]
MSRNQQFRGFFPFIPDTILYHPGINPAADLGINRVNGKGHMLDPQFLDFIQMLKQRQSVGAKAQVYAGHAGPDLAERFKSPVRVRERIAGAGNPDDG